MKILIIVSVLPVAVYSYRFVKSSWLGRLDRLNEHFFISVVSSVRKWIRSIKERRRSKFRVPSCWENNQKKSKTNYGRAIGSVKKYQFQFSFHIWRMTTKILVVNLVYCFFNTFIPSFFLKAIYYSVWKRAWVWGALSRSRRCIHLAVKLRENYDLYIYLYTEEVGRALIERRTLRGRELFTLALLLFSLSNNKVDDGVQSYLFLPTSIFLIFCLLCLDCPSPILFLAR